MTVYVVYGTTAPLEEITEAIERSLGTSMVLRSSSYFGDYADWHGKDGEAISVKPNDLGQGELLEPEHPEYPTLIYFDRSARVDDIVKSLSPLQVERIMVLGEASR